MKGPVTPYPGAMDANYLRDAVEREVLPVFRASSSPKLPDAEVRDAVRLLFELLDLRLGDRGLDGVGRLIRDCLVKYFVDREYATIAAHFEHFGKFLLKLIRPTRYDDLTRELLSRFVLSKVLKEFDLASKGEMEDWTRCPWQKFPPADLLGMPDFKEQVGWTYKFRNTEGHLPLEQDRVREPTVFRSVCVSFVWLVAKFKREIQTALIRARFSGYLERVRRDERRRALTDSGVELTVRPRSAEEYRVANPLLPVMNAPVAEEEIGVFKLPETNRVTVIEGEAGAGKTTALELIACRQADRLLDGEDHMARLPVLVRLKACKSSLAAHLEEDLGLGRRGPPDVPWDSLLLLVDGLNEVSQEVQSQFQMEIQDLLQRHAGLRLVVAGRLNSVRGEYPAAIVQLQPLRDERLGELIRKVVPSGDRSRAIMAAILRTPGLLALARTPFYAATLANLAKTEDLATLTMTNRAAVVRACIGRFLRREETQASAGVNRTYLEKKQLLLAGLAFDTKSAGESTFPHSRARQILERCKEQLAPGLDVLDFIEELVVNHLLEWLPDGRLAFAHDIYQDYFAAFKLKDEELSDRAGVKHALDRFSDPAWEGCIRLFAELSDRSRILIEEGAERNPALTWCLLADAGTEDARLRGIVADAAYCALTSDLADPKKAVAAKACLPVLAALERIDLLTAGIRKQRQFLEPEGLQRLSEAQKKEAERGIQTAMLPLGHGLITLLQLGVIEQQAGKPGKFFEAGRQAISTLKDLRSAMVLGTILGAWSGNSFDRSSLVPGLLLDSLIDLGVDAVLYYESVSMNRVLAAWLDRASESGYARAWPAYGRVLRLASRDYVSDNGIAYEPLKALHWLRRAHEAGDQNGSRELALLLLENPELSQTPGTGEQLLRRLAETDLESRCELGLRLLKGEDLPQAEPEGLGHLLSAAEAGHSRARDEVMMWLVELCAQQSTVSYVLPAWARSLAGRLKALIPDFPVTDGS